MSTQLAENIGHFLVVEIPNKKPRVDQGNNVEQQVLMEQEQQDLREKEQSDRQEKLVRLESRMTNPTLETKISA